MKEPILAFGILSGAIVVAYTFAIFAFFGDFTKILPEQLQLVEMLGYLRYVILLLGIFFGVRTLRNQSDEHLKWSKLLDAGVVCAAVVAVVVGLMEFGYLQFINPNFYDEYGQLYVEQMKLRGASEQELASAVQQMESFSWMKSPLMTGVFYFVETFSIGVVGALIVATLLRRRTT